MCAFPKLHQSLMKIKVIQQSWSPSQRNFTHLCIYAVVLSHSYFFTSEGKNYFKTLSLWWGKEKKPRGKNSEAKEFLTRNAFRPVSWCLTLGLICLDISGDWVVEPQQKRMRWAFKQLKSLQVQGLENMREKHDSKQRRLINLVYILK